MGKFSAFSPLKCLCECHPNSELVSKLRPYLQQKSWSEKCRQLILDLLSEALLNEDLRPQTAQLFAPILSDLFIRLRNKTEKREQLFVAISDLIGHYLCANDFAYECFQTSIFSPISLLETTSDEKSVLNILISSLNYLILNPIWFRDAIDWTFILQYISDPNPGNRYIAIKCYLILFSLTDNHFDTLFKQQFSAEELTRLRVKYLSLFSSRIPTTRISDSLHYKQNDDKIPNTCDQCFGDNDFSDHLVSFDGVLIKRFKNSEIIDGNNGFKEIKIVLVPTTQSNVRSIALALSYGKPVLIEGPVGSGKTLLVEYMASLTGRHRAPQLMKVQMGDQIDAKILIGSHICTDIPGEFIWKSGPLTQSMKYGFWLLLEDIDCAPSDVISMLSSVLEAKSLSSLPGCENQLNRVHNDFRIFFTRRLTGGQNSDSKHSEFAIKSSNHYNCINKLCYKISLELLTREELSTIISTKWKNLNQIKDKILDIYYLLQNESSENVGLKRQISLRDLMKWCQRITKNFKLNSDESAFSVFMDANDCFLQSISNQTLRISKAELIGSHLNITGSESEYLCAKRKPEFLLNEKLFKIGRITVKLNERSDSLVENRKHFHSFALTQQSLSLLERISVSVDNKEPVLLCGETGTGKTSCVQYLANRLDKCLTVINMNQQSDSSDLLGGYKPIEMSVLMEPIRDKYLDLFSKTFEVEKNASFLSKFAQKFRSQDWKTLFVIMVRVIESALIKTKDNQVLRGEWKALGDRMSRLQSYKLDQKECLAFSFIEGSLVKAMRSGEWILLDEINLAESETLQCLSAVLDSDDGSVILLDKADGLPVERNAEFRLFACMNPATDVGKKELPLGIRNRFTEFFVDELEDKSDLRILIHSYIGKYISPNLIESIVNFYLQIKLDSKTVLTDTNGMRPIYSLRTLCRALSVAATNPCGIVLRSLYESFCLSFLTRLDKISRMKVETNIIKSLFGPKDSLSLLRAKIEAPKTPEKYECIEGFYILKGSKEPKTNESYILTETVKKNLKDICRIVSIGKTFPVLLEGETSVGKTSLIEWLAAVTGNVCVRVNNHEHTDLQEYVGSYCSNTNGKLVFKEGVLAEAMRNGYWIILDELNLAPTEVLEALNRVLDDNRELYIPETQQLIKADPRFLLLATQNPAGHYGGRKVLSRAFRNRFVELHFDSIPSEELEVILHQRCTLPMSYAKRMVGVLLDLQVRRRESGVFAGKHGFITLRDLFRWGERYNKFSKQQSNEIQFYDWDLHLANDGYKLLAGRVRRPEETELILSVLEKRFKRKLDINSIFSGSSFLNDFEGLVPKEFQHIVWNKSFKRLGTLVSEAIKYNEPILLVGETGCGKTSICQLFAAINNRELLSVNCHMNTESADFLGSLRPVRKTNSENNDESNKSLFEWVDGPLVEAMKFGHFFLVDEISLADDSVLERLNSVLESERILLIAENNNTFDNEISIPIIKAKESFRYMATMNPGGDYGKRELSPALRNRFTEIWCPPYEDITDIKDIICHNLEDQWFPFKEIVCQSMSEFLLFFNSNIYNSKRIVLSVRDILGWIEFMNANSRANCAIRMSFGDLFINGALLVFVDAIGSANSSFNTFIKNTDSIRNECQRYLKRLSDSMFGINSDVDTSDIILDNNKYFAIKPFVIPKGPTADPTINDFYMWNSPTVQKNSLRVLRALQLPKPILLEGMPGVGKTTLVQALAKASGHRLIRINLSEQTDVSDLFGADLPIEGEDSAGKFAFRDGPLLQALKSDWTWILLDELNLANQSVLEGLNACLDHRSEIFIPELNKSFKISKTMTRIFVTQNPHSEGGARKGLPRSFLNRFTTVYMENLSPEDYIFILSNMFPKVENSVIQQMIDFNNEVIEEIIVKKRFGQKGSPWEFNLRELIRWCQVMTQNISDFSEIKAEKFVKMLFIDKMRTIDDRIKMKEICDKYFKSDVNSEDIDFEVTDSYLQIGKSFLNRRRTLANETTNLIAFKSQKQCLESLMKCIEMNWMSILIGESGAGKTSAVKLLSDIVGHKLRIFAVNSEMDTMDLLGGFEQKDLSHHLNNIEESVIRFCSKTFQQFVDQKEIMRTVLKLWFKIQTLNSLIESTNESALEKLSLLAQMVDRISELNPKEVDITSQLRREIHLLKSNYKNKVLFVGSFEWRDSVLIRALIDGEWLLIDNANLCSASVLDRLNGLLEPNGELTISEKGSIDGQLTTIRPHPDFRLILTMDPTNGELSRAMRNRGIEINMFPINLKEDFDKQIRSLVQSDDNISEFFVDFLENNFNNSNEKFNFSLFIENIKSFIFQLQNGFGPEFSLKEFYKKFAKQSISDEEIVVLINKIVTKTSKTKSMPRIDLNNYKYDSLTSSAAEDSLLLEPFVQQKTFEFNDNYWTSFRLYLEKSSLNDNAIRNYILNDYYSVHCFRNNSELVKDIGLNIQNLFQTISEPKILNEFQLDLRFNASVWQLFLHLNKCFDNNIESIEGYLNRYSMNMFWNQLKSQLLNVNQLNDKNLMSFMGIASDLINSKIPRNSFPKIFIDIYNIINEIEVKLIKCSLDLCPTSDDFITLRDIILWFYQLLTICHQNYTKRELLSEFIVEKFTVLWILINEKSLSILQSFLDIDLNHSISAINQLLEIDGLDFDHKKQKLLLSLTNNSLVFKSKESATLFVSYNQLSEELIAIKQTTNSNEFKDAFLMIGKNICSLISGDYNSFHLQKDISLIQQLIQNSSTSEMTDSDEDIDFVDLINKRKSMANIQMEPIIHFWLFYSEMLYFNNKFNNRFDVYLHLIESKNLSLNPLHISCISLDKNSSNISTDLVLQYFRDFHQNMQIINVLNHLTDSSSDLTKIKSNISDERILQLSAECLPFISLSSSYLLSSKHNFIGLLNQKKCQLLQLKQFLTLNFDLIYDSDNYSFVKLEFEFVKNWFSSLVQNICLNSPVKKSTLSLRTDSFKQLINNISQLIGENKDSFDSSVVLIFVGLMTSHMLCPTFPIDPIERSSIKLNHYLIDLKLIKAELSARKALSVIRSNNSSIESSDHSLIRELIDRERQLERKIQKFESKLPFRSSSSEYFKLKSDCKQFLETIINRNIIENFTQKLIKLYRDRNATQKSMKILIQESINFQTSITSFIRRIQSIYPLYQDLVNVFLIGVSLLLKGLKNATFYLKNKSFITNELKFDSTTELNKTIEIVGNFCHTNSPAFIANYLCNSETINRFTKLSNVSKLDFETNISTLLRSALFEIQNEMLLNGSESLQLISFQILNVFVKCWQNLREIEELKRTEEEALFEYRTKSHESEESEEEMDKKQIQSIFPTFHEQYTDFVDGFAVEDNNKINLIESKLEIDIISDIISTHLKIVEPIDRTVKTVPDFQKSYALRHSVVSQIIKYLGIFFDNSIDSQLIAGQLIVCNHLVRETETNDLSDSFNIYQNSSLSETNLCFKTLETLENRIVFELLPQFENHPILIKLLKLIKKLFEFSSKDPLMKFATGLEVLLQSAQDWQLIAHKGISLVDNLNEITQLVISWRKLELKYWSECLDSVHRRIEEKQLNRFWFHLYITITALIENNSTNDCNQNEMKDFIVSIKQFIEDSKLGEFKVRLNLLKTFMLHVLTINGDQNLNNNYLFICLYNLYKFYSQFLPNIENALISVRKPIEKEVKEFVKIAKWSENNFWSVKSAVDKSHKQLYKYIKKYESQLNLTVDSHLSLQTNENHNSVSNWELILNFSKVFANDSERYEPISDLSNDYSLLQKIPNLSKKAKRIARKLVKSTSFISKRINSIEMFSIDLINGIKCLSELQVPSDLKDKTKWKKSVNHIQKRKRRELSELFKSLSHFGLSYRKGLVIENDFDMNTIIMTTGPLSYKDSENSKLSIQMIEDLNSCDNYFYKCLARFASLRIGLQSPNNQLTIGFVERIKGFSAQLMKKVVDNRKLISENLFYFKQIKSIEQNICKLSETTDDLLIIPKKEFTEYLTSIQNLIVRIISYLFRSIDLLDSLSTSIEEPVLRLSDHQNINICDQKINELKHSMDSYKNKFKGLLNRIKELENSSENSVYFLQDLQQLKNNFKTLLSFTNELKTCYSDQSFCSSLCLEKNYSILLNETNLLNQKFDYYSDYYIKGFETSNELIESENLMDLSAKHCMKSIKIILFSFQKLFKSFNERESDSTEDFLKNAFSFTDLNVLNDFQIKATFDSILKLLNNFNAIKPKTDENSTHVLSFLKLRAKLLTNIYPFLKSYSKLFEYFLTLSMSSLRTSNKLLFILLSLFSELTQNGFCLPQELSEETDDKDTGSELKSVEDGGLGEGQGTKDVSDKIESEDQLEEAFKASDKQEKSDENDDKDIEEEDNGIEMENDFDGQTYSPSKGEENSDKESDGEEESDDNLEDQMGDVDNNSDVLDEKMWGSDDDQNDSEQSEDEDETGFDGKDSIDSKVVAKEENKELKSDENSPEEENETDLEINENENELQNDDYRDEEIDPYKQNESKTDKSKQELPENMELDDNEDNEEKDETPEEVDNISISGESSTDEENDLDFEESEQNLDNNDIEDNKIDETKCEKLDKELDENDSNDGEEKSEDKESIPNPNKEKDLLNDQIFGSEESEKVMENQTNATNPSDISVQQTVEQNSEQNEGQNEEQHGFGESLSGDQSTPSDTQQMQSSVPLDDSDVKEERYEQTNKKDKTRRTLADNYDKTAKRQKVLQNEDISDNNSDNNSKNERINSKLYKHIENELKANNKVIDLATNEEKLIQSEEPDDKEVKDDIDFDKPEDMEIEEKDDSVEELKAIDLKSIKNLENNCNNNRELNKSDINEEQMETEGEVIPTQSVQRGNESTFHTSLHLNQLNESNEMSVPIEKRFDELSVNMIKELDINSVIDVWKECEAKVSPLVYELCERLQLVLEPTKMSKLKGDYRTGKRLNLRKVIAYIASDFRKDKIWLRRTKASKRQYQIIIAVDDSSSMSDNKSKQLAFESLALLGKSLSLLEAGELAIMSFGQTVNLLHSFGQPFNDSAGAHLLTRFGFDQNQTRIADLLQSAIELMSTSRTTSSQNTDISQLLIIVSDGRGIYSEGEQRVKQMLRKVKELGIFVVFVVIDNPLSKDSILDIRVPIFDNSGSVRLESYMERFAFQFYILLRDINGLPQVMGEALRQWFELITSGQT